MTRCTDCTTPDCLRDQGCDKPDAATVVGVPHNSTFDSCGGWARKRVNDHVDSLRADVAALIAERDEARARATAFFDEHSRITAERDEALARLAEYESVRVDVRAVHVEGNEIELDLDAPERVLALFVDAFAKMFEQHPGAVNYIEQTVRRRCDCEGYIVTIQKQSKKSPHQLRSEAEAERDRWRKIALAARPAVEYAVKAAERTAEAMAYMGARSDKPAEFRAVLAMYPEADHD